LGKKIETRKIRNNYFDEKFIWFIFHQICLAVMHLHENGIVHRDLKPLNILLIKQDKHVKLADLGVSRQVSQNTFMLKTFYGTPLYLSPELVENSHYNEKTGLFRILIEHLKCESSII
jgi:serine/threonine protein kinase